MSIELSAGLGLRVTLRITAIVEAAPRAPDGTMTAEGREYIWREVMAEFGPDVATTILGSQPIELHYASDTSKRK